MLVYPSSFTLDWLESDAALAAFQSWTAERAPRHIQNQAQLALAGFITLSGSFWEAQGRIRALDRSSAAFRHLHQAMFHLWVDTPDEHEQFHMWADPQHPGDMPQCSGCWS